MDGDSSGRSVMGCRMPRRLHLVRELRGMRLAALPGRMSVKMSRLPMSNGLG
jgi:hypothetical protein